MKRRNALLTLSAPLLVPAQAQDQTDILVKISGGQMPVIAIPDFRGGGDAQKWMTLFNQTLFDEIYTSGVFKVAPKSFYPLRVPQQPQDWNQANGPWLTDWSAASVKANYLAMGYTAIQNGRLVLSGWLYDVTQKDTTNAQMFGKIYLAAIDENGTRKIAREFAADILARFGAKSLMGSKIYFVSNRSGAKEIWSMDYDGSGQEPFTKYASICTTPALSQDNTKIAFTSFLRGNPGITIHNAAPNRRLTFVNPDSSVVVTPDFLSDGKRLLFSTKVGSSYPNIFIANTDGSNMRRLTSSRFVEVEPKANPKNENEVLFVSGRSGPQQIYKMNLDGADIQRLTDGSGQASNPAWHPNGQLMAFSWTRGFEPGNFNIFVMEIAKRELIQLSKGAGRNENPTWAPDGRHLVFSSNRGGSTQIWSMLADGTQLKQLTTAGRNEMPVWSH